MPRHRQPGPARSRATRRALPAAVILGLLLVGARGFVAQLERPADGVSTVIAAEPVPSRPVPTASATVPPSTVADEATEVPATPAVFTTTVNGVRCTGPDRPDGRALARRAQQLVGAAVGARKDDVSVAFLDRTSGIRCDYRGETAYEAASIVKVATSAALIWQVERGGEAPTSSQTSLIRRAVEVSDNDAQSALWTQVGGRRGISAFLRVAGMADTVPSAEWGLTLTTALDEMRLMYRLVHGGMLTDAGTDLLLGSMRSIDPAQDWGITAGAPAGAEVALKNGWYPASEGWRMHSIGAVTGGAADYSLAVLTEDAPSEQAGIDTVERIARAVHKALADQG